MTKYCGGNDPRGSDNECLLTFMLGKSIFQCVFLPTSRYLEIQPLGGLHAEATPTIGVNIFIKLNKPFDVQKSTIALGVLGKVGEEVPIALSPEDIPPKPLDKVSKK